MAIERRMLGIFVLLLAWANSQSTPITQMPQNTLQNFTQIGSKLYYIEQSSKSNWFLAADKCRQLNGTLANLVDEEELLELSRKLNPSSSYWLGVNDLAIQGVYTAQATGYEAEFLNWAAGQPDNIGGKEHCVELWYDLNVFRMNDASCEIPFLFICEGHEKSNMC
ncbi:C-type lectin 37Db [Scaptodrosophila lebanonensis]|uniref:C-type lectin 37Db n=1 Tax=Drosophila lebanonensis TaxID=7225 RepID=A0A6J2TLB2_DROLE|nr:C-type lectin 37Db [Scaptodrosophila lebanonensis]